MSEVDTSPMKVYQMVPEYYGAALIAVVSGKDFLKLVRESGNNVENYEESMRGNEDKTLLLPGFDFGNGIAIDKTMGHFLENESIEEMFTNEGYVVLDLGN